MKRRCVFVDRDGTLNAEVGFVSSRDGLQVLPGARDALLALREAAFDVVVVTNQSGIARGLYTEADLARVHGRLHEELAGVPRAWLHCPHHPEAQGPYGGPCLCRKPEGGLLLQARELLGIDFDGGYLVGDSARDLLMGRDLPLTTVLVQSGKPWEPELQTLQAAGGAPAAVLADLTIASRWIIARG